MSPFASFRKALAVALVSSVLPVMAFAQQSTAKGSSSVLDLGLTDPKEVVQVLLVLNVRQADQLTQLVYDQVDPKSTQYHKFLSTAEFAQRFGASDLELLEVILFLKLNGISTTSVLKDHLAIEATGTVGQFEKAFQAPVHNFQDAHGRRFRRPLSRPQFPNYLQGVLVAVTGLDTGTQQQSHHVNVSAKVEAVAKAHGKALTAPKPTASSCTACAMTSNEAGYYSVGDVEQIYNASPLLSAGVTGKSSTVGVISLAAFDPADAFAYWKYYGLTVDPNRITTISIFGGPQAADDPSGGGRAETSLDVEQAGGIAPDSKVYVYQAPNTNGGFLGAIYQAVSDNITDSLSISWGEPEIFYTAALNDGEDATNQLQAFHQAFMEAGAQGIPVFVATGDSGAYDLHETLAEYDTTVPYNYSEPLTVNAPASDPFVSAAGGTTRPLSSYISGLLAYDLSYFVSAGYLPSSAIIVPPAMERVWGQDYIMDWAQFYSLLDGSATPQNSPSEFLGGGGGVSVLWPVPAYQQGVSGVQQSQPKQSLVVLNPSTSPLFPAAQTTPQTLYTLPSKYAGRNLPDISSDADPFSGFTEISAGESDPTEEALGGGTSFVAPQFSGFAALLKQKLGHRVGFLNPAVYRLQAKHGYSSTSGLQKIDTGDNWFYFGLPSYNPGAGLGTLNVTQLASELQGEDSEASAGTRHDGW